MRRHHGRRLSEGQNPCQLTDRKEEFSHKGGNLLPAHWISFFFFDLFCTKITLRPSTRTRSGVTDANPYRDFSNSSGVIPKPLANPRIVVKWIFTPPASIRASCRGSNPDRKARSRKLRFLSSRMTARSCPNLRRDFSFLSMNQNCSCLLIYMAEQQWTKIWFVR